MAVWGPVLLLSIMHLPSRFFISPSLTRVTDIMLLIRVTYIIYYYTTLQLCLSDKGLNSVLKKEPEISTL